MMTSLLINITILKKTNHVRTDKPSHIFCFLHIQKKKMQKASILSENVGLRCPK